MSYYIPLYGFATSDGGEPQTQQRFLWSEEFYLDICRIFGCSVGLAMFGTLINAFFFTIVYAVEGKPIITVWFYSSILGGVAFVILFAVLLYFYLRNHRS